MPDAALQRQVERLKKLLVKWVNKCEALEAGGE